MWFKRPALNPARRRLDGALTIGDLRRIAGRRTPKAAFDYADGAAEAEMVRRRLRASRHHVGSDRHLRGSGLDPVPVARQARRKGIQSLDDAAGLPPPA